MVNVELHILQLFETNKLRLEYQLYDFHVQNKTNGILIY